MPNLPAVEATKRAVHDTRTRVLLSKTKMTSIAEALSLIHISEPTRH